MGCPAMGAEVPKKARWNHLYAMWKDLQQVRQSLCLALMDGAMEVDA